MSERVESPSDSKLWVMQQSTNVHVLVSDAVWNDEIDILNDREFDEALTHLMFSRSLSIAGDPVIPPDFMYPTLALPLTDFSPEYFELKSKVFVSRRFREVMNQPADVLQYWPVDVVCGTAKAFAKDYMMLRVLAYQPALDWERSAYTSKEITDRETGEKLTFLSSIAQFIPIDSFIPRTEVFRPAEDPLTTLVTDRLAERVACSKCEGVSFDEPETIRLVNKAPRRRRMDYGVLVVDAELAD